jgi:hypothetical protein
MKTVMRFMWFVLFAVLLSCLSNAQGQGGGGGNGGGANGGGGNGQGGGGNGGGGNGGGGNGGGGNGGGGGGGMNIQTPSVTVGSNTGVIESYLLAAHAVRHCAQSLKDNISWTNTQSVVVFDQNQHDLLNALSAFQVQNTITAQTLKTAIDQYDQLPPLPNDLEPPAPIGVTEAVPIANSIMQSLVNLVSLFKTDITVGGTAVTLDDEILIDEVASAIKPTKTFRPTLYFAEILDANSVTSSGVVASLQNLYKQRQQAFLKAAKAQREIANLTNRLKAATNDADRTRIGSYLSPRNDALAGLQAAISIFDSFVNRLSGTSLSGTGNAAVNQGGQGQGGQSQGGQGQGGQGQGAQGQGAQGQGGQGQGGQGQGGQGQGGQGQGGQGQGGQGQGGQGQGGQNPGGANQGGATNPQQGVPTLANLVMAELLIAKIKTAGTGILVLHIQQSGGGYMTKSSIWTFFGGAKLFHSGGTITTFALLSPMTGEVLAAGSCPAYSGYIKYGDVSNELAK